MVVAVADLRQRGRDRDRGGAAGGDGQLVDAGACRLRPATAAVTVACSAAVSRSKSAWYCVDQLLDLGLLRLQLVEAGLGGRGGGVRLGLRLLGGVLRGRRPRRRRSFVCAAIMSSVVICWTSSVGGLAGEEGGDPGLGLAGVAALGDGPQLRLVDGERRAVPPRPAAAAAGGGLLLRRDGELGLVHLLVDDGELLRRPPARAWLPRPPCRAPAPAGAGARTPVAAAIRAAPRARTARERRRVVVRVDCTVRLRLLRRARGRGHIHARRKRTVGNRCRQVADGALGCRTASHHVRHSAPQELPASTPVAPFTDGRMRARRQPRPRGMHRRRRNAPEMQETRSAHSGGAPARRIAPPQPRGRCPCSAGEGLLRLQARRRSGGRGGSRRVRRRSTARSSRSASSKVARPRRPPAWSSAIAR